ncbi:MAG: response regulator transcription factor [Anaerolineae bacterium]
MDKILIVDDEIGIRLTLEDILVRDGHQVFTAASGLAALDLIATQTFDLVLLDLNLGDISGTEVLTVLHRQSPDTVAIMLTAYGSLETAVEALRQGAHDYLFKPCQTVDLRESVRQGLLKGRQIRRQRHLLKQLGQFFANTLDDIQEIVEEDATPPLKNSGATHPNETLSATTGESITEPPGRFLKYGPLMVDKARHIITLNGHLLELSPTEFNLLAYLMSEAPRVVPPQELIRQVQGYESEHWEASEIIRSHISHIRQKAKQANIIQTIRSRGYTIAEL